jgi:hypothetical protein
MAIVRFLALVLKCRQRYQYRSVLILRSHAPIGGLDLFADQPAAAATK